MSNHNDKKFKCIIESIISLYSILEEFRVLFHHVFAIKIVYYMSAQIKIKHINVYNAWYSVQFWCEIFKIKYASISLMKNLIWDFHSSFHFAPNKIPSLTTKLIIHKLLYIKIYHI